MEFCSKLGSIHLCFQNRLKCSTKIQGGTGFQTAKRQAAKSECWNLELLPRKRKVWFTWKSTRHDFRVFSGEKMMILINQQVYPMMRIHHPSNQHDSPDGAIHLNLEIHRFTVHLHVFGFHPSIPAELHHHDSGQCFRSSNQKRKSNFLLPLTNHNAQTQAPPVASQFWECFDLLEDQGSQGVSDEKDLSQEFFNGKTAKHCHFLLAKHRHIHAVIPVFVWWPFLKHYPGPPFSKARHLQVGPAILKFDLL